MANSVIALPWLSSMLERELLHTPHNEFPLKDECLALFQVTTHKPSLGGRPNQLLVNNLLGSQYTVTDGSLSIQTSIKDVDTVVDAFNRRNAAHLRGLSVGMLILPLSWVILVRKRANKIELSLEIRKFGISGIGSSKIPPSKLTAFGKSAAFTKISNAAQGVTRVKDEQMVTVQAAGVSALETNTARQSNGPIMATKRTSAAETVIHAKEPEETPDPIIRQSPQPRAQPNTTTASLNIIPHFESTLFNMTDFENLPLKRSLAMVPQNQQETLGEKYNFFPTEPGKPPHTTAPLPITFLEELWPAAHRQYAAAVELVLAQTEVNDQLSAEKEYSLQASQTSSPITNSAQAGAPTEEQAGEQDGLEVGLESSDEELLDWDPSPVQSRKQKRVDSLPPDTPSPSMHLAINGSKVDSLRRIRALPISEPNDTSPTSTMGMPAEVPRALVATNARDQGFLASSPSARSANVEVVVGTPRESPMRLASRPLSSVPPTPLGIPSRAFNSLAQIQQAQSTRIALSPQNELLYNPALTNKNLKRKILSERTPAMPGSKRARSPASVLGTDRSSRASLADSLPSAQTSGHNTLIDGLMADALRSSLRDSRRSSAPKVAKYSIHQVFADFCTKYPEYKGDIARFANVCLELFNTNVPIYGYDDYIIRQEREYPAWASLRLQRGQEVESYTKYYNENASSLLYKEGVMTLDSLNAVVRFVEDNDYEQLE